jgi:hypothetical protein
MLLSMVQHVYQRHLRWILSVYFEQGRQQTMDILWPGMAHSVTTSNNVQVQDVMCEERYQIIHFPSNGNEHRHQQTMQLYGILNITKYVPSECPSIDQYCCNICSSTILRIICVCRGLCRTMSCGITIWTQEKQQACKQRHSISPQPQKFKSQQSDGKVLLTMFLDTELSLFLDLKPCNNTVDAHHYCHTLE